MSFWILATIIKVKTSIDYMIDILDNILEKIFFLDMY